MKLLLTCDAVGGVWQYSLDLARGLRAHDVETVLAVMGPAPSPGQRAGAEAVCAEVIETGLPLDWLAADAEEVRAAAQAIAKLAGEARADLVQLHAPALAAGVRFSVPVVAAIHSDVGTWWAAVRGGGLPDDFGWRVALVGEGLAAADLAVAPSRAFADQVAAYYGARPQAVHNGRTAMPVSAAGRADHAFTAGRLWDAAKDLVTFDEAAALSRTPFRAAGPVQGPHGERILPRHATALGSLSDEALGAELAARPVFVSTAVYEPFGLAVLEAAQAGCALVLADTPTFRELWDGAALFVPPRDPGAVARAVDALIAGPTQRDALGAAARERAGRYTPEATAARMADLYARLLAPALEAAA